ncbi:MAG TPA: FapA family protein [Tepidisphaeraceae bacterium]|jgi:chemotaxis protein CheX|nr:FapA family protein [Tepidisphaeraceae bacterium]
MNDAKQPGADPFRIDISGDVLSATLIIEEGAMVEAAAVLAKLNELGVKRVDQKAIAERIEAAAGQAVNMLVAMGIAPIDQRQEGFILSLPADPAQLEKVTGGTVVATISPSVAGKAGQDVFGGAIPFKKRTDKLEIGRGLIKRDGMAIATSDGSVRLRGELLSVDPLLDMDGSDESVARELEFDGDVVIQNCFRDCRSLRSTGSIWVEDAVEAAQLDVADSLYVTNAIIGKDKGRYVVGKDITCKFISAAQIISRRDIRVDGEVAISRISCIGSLVANGPIYGGEVSANGGIRCPVLGGAGGTTTIIECGIDAEFRTLILAKSIEIDDNRKHVEQVRQKLAPLLSQQKHLLSSQREKATELLWEADELDSRTNKEIATLADRCKASRAMARSEIVVAETAYPGVIIRFPGVEAVINSQLQGPLTLVPRGNGQGIHIVMIDGTDGSEHPIESRIVPDPSAPLIDRFFGKPPTERGTRTKCINAFVAATRELFQTMVRVPFTLDKPRLKDPGERIFKLYKISVGIQLTGMAQGGVWISFSEKVAIALATALSGETYKSLDADCRDALGEIANMIVGAAKRNISDRPIKMSVPTLQPTEEIVYLPNIPAIVLPFDTAAGRFIIEVAMTETSSGQASQAIAA